MEGETEISARVRKRLRDRADADVRPDYHGGSYTLGGLADVRKGRDLSRHCCGMSELARARDLSYVSARLLAVQTLKMVC